MGQLKKYSNNKTQRPDPPKAQGVPNYRQRPTNNQNNKTFIDNGNDSFLDGVIVGAVLEELIESDDE